MAPGEAALLHQVGVHPDPVGRVPKRSVRLLLAPEREMSEAHCGGKGIPLTAEPVSEAPVEDTRGNKTSERSFRVGLRLGF